MIRRLGVDRHRVSVMGHSMGSAGAAQIAKAYPGAFATACIFNNGFSGPTGVHPLFGDAALDLPSNLVNSAGETVHMAAVWDLTSNIAPQRDLPLVRVFDGKDDLDGTMRWDSLVVVNYREADSLGLGPHLYWDERVHALDQWDGHWSHGVLPDSQTARDDAAYQMNFRSDRSYPAFYNLEAYGASGDPGTGDPATGDPWGTWGGYHDWLRGTLTDTPATWSATVFLVGGTGAPLDSCPQTSLTSDLAIRKPQQFLPLPGDSIEWAVIRVSNGDTLQAGSTVVDPEGVVRAQGITVYRDPGRVRVHFRLGGATEVEEADAPVLPGTDPASLSLAIGPNPFRTATTVRFSLGEAARVEVEIFDVTGRKVRVLARSHRSAGEHRIAWDGRDDAGRALSPGLYLCRVRAGDAKLQQRIVRLD